MLDVTAEGVLIASGLAGVAWKMFALASNVAQALETMESLHESGRSMESQMSVMLGTAEEAAASRSDSREKIKDLHEWHNRTDADGVPVWYVRQGLERNIESLTKAITKQNVLFERIIQRLEGGAP